MRANFRHITILQSGVAANVSGAFRSLMRSTSPLPNLHACISIVVLAIQSISASNAEFEIYLAIFVTN